MARVPYVTRDELDAEGQAIYDRIRQDRNAPEAVSYTHLTLPTILRV